MYFTENTLGEICDKSGGFIRTGPFGSQLHESDYVEHGIPVVMPKNIIDGKVSTDSIAYIDEKNAKRLSAHRLAQGDIVYGRRGDIGRRAIVTHKEVGWLCGTGCLRITQVNKVLDSLYLYYYLGQLEIIRWIANHAIGATLPNLNTGILRSVPILYPSLPIQRIIADILSAYDDLIENNTRRIAILEEMARTLYHEWFVKFRFPGYEQVKMVESELGMVPEGWEVVKLKDFAFEIRRSINPDTVEPQTPYFGLEHLPRRSIALTSWGTAQSVQSTKLAFKKSEILFGKIRPYLHKVGIAPIDGVCSSDTLIIDSRQEQYKNLLLFLVSSDQFVEFASKTSQGTQMPRANWDVLSAQFVVLPPQGLLRTFNSFVDNAVESIVNLIFRNIPLRRIRDLLLPKLISGKIDVSSWVDGDAQEAAQELVMSCVGGGRDSVTSGEREAGPVEQIEKDTMVWRSLWD